MTKRKRAARIAAVALTAAMMVTPAGAVVLDDGAPFSRFVRQAITAMTWLVPIPAPGPPRLR